MKFLKQCAAVALCVLAGSAQAFFVKADTSYNGQADVKGSGGAEVKSTVYQLSAGTENFTFLYKRTDYDFSGIDDPFDSLNRLVFDAHADGDFTGEWGWFGGLGLGFGFEDDFNADENYQIMPRLGISYMLTPTIKGFLGAAANVNEADNKFLPIIGIMFGRDSDIGLSGSIAYPATKVTYRLNSMFAVEGVFLTIKELYQLNDDSKFIKSGYVMEESYGVSAGVVFTPVKLLTIKAGLHGYFDREYTFYNRHGSEIGSNEHDDCIGGYLSVNLAF